MRRREHPSVEHDARVTQAEGCHVQTRERIRHLEIGFARSVEVAAKQGFGLGFLVSARQEQPLQSDYWLPRIPELLGVGQFLIDGGQIILNPGDPCLEVMSLRGIGRRISTSVPRRSRRRRFASGRGPSGRCWPPARETRDARHQERAAARETSARTPATAIRLRPEGRDRVGLGRGVGRIVGSSFRRARLDILLKMAFFKTDRKSETTDEKGLFRAWQPWRESSNMAATAGQEDVRLGQTTE